MKETTPLLSILLILAASVCGALGAFLYKTAAQFAGPSVASIAASPRLWGGVICYVLVMTLFVAAFRNGGALTVLYPTYASTFIIGAVISRLAYGTPINLVNLAGMTLLVAGMYLMSFTK
ncbi:hypothetical protein [Luteolibacter marinus]|uniref:hypothetical protein n=1 Tax=Luteolibacter marinus TaxID=2776705 RepID=UPI00186652B4|nr:hypothetical protein [Luteolibacter marinus]